MAIRRIGRYETTDVGGEMVRAFVPHSLPPSNPRLDIAGELAERVQAAEQALRRLDVAGTMVPALDWFIYAFVRKEAVLSSQIEGTQATLMDLLSYEAHHETEATPPSLDVEEVCNYLDALAFCRSQLSDPSGLPLSIRLLNEAHRLLLRGARGGNKLPGEVRRSQNWIGGSRPGNAAFVPPPHTMVGELLSDLEHYIHGQHVHGDEVLPPIVRIGLIHVQFETIHPYLDGNGRIGRLLITLLLERWALLQSPILYLSLFLKRHRQEYYLRLDAVRAAGDWEGWLTFFLDGVATTADEAVSTATDLFALVAEDRTRLLEKEGVNILALQLFERLPEHPIVTARWVVERFGSTLPTAGRAIEALEDVGVLVETTGRKRDRIYAYRAYLNRLKDGTEP